MKKYLLLHLFLLLFFPGCKILKPDSNVEVLVEMVTKAESVRFFIELNDDIFIDWGDEKAQKIEFKDKSTRLICSHFYDDSEEVRILKIKGSSKALRYLSCDRNRLTDFKLFKNTNLHYLSVSYNKLQELTIPASNKIENIGCAYNRIQKLDVSGFPNLVNLSCEKNPLEELDVAANPKLRYLAFCHTNISEIDLSQNVDIEKIILHASKVEELNVSNNQKLLEIKCYATPLAKNKENILKMVDTLPSRTKDMPGQLYLYNDEVEGEMRHELKIRNWYFERL